MKKVFMLMMAVAAACLDGMAQNPSFSVAEYKGGKLCATSFTFDDGLPEHYSIVMPELEKRGWKGTFWICGAKVNGEIRRDDSFLGWEQIKEMSRRGHEISNHGWNHKKLTKLSHERIVEEVEKNDSAIFANTGIRPVTFCYPYNSKNEQVLEVTEQGRVGTRTRQFAFGQAVDDAKTRRRMDAAVKNKEWAVWMTHGITEGYDAFKEPERFFGFLDYVKSREDVIWVGSFREVASYIKERESVELTVENNGRRWSLLPVCGLDPELFDQRLTLVIETDSNKVRVKQGGKRLVVNYEEGRVLVDFSPYEGEIIVKL